MWMESIVHGNANILFPEFCRLIIFMRFTGLGSYVIKINVIVNVNVNVIKINA